MNFTSISGYVLAAKSSQSAVVGEPKLKFAPLKGDRVAGEVEIKFLAAEKKNSSFCLTLTLGDAHNTYTVKCKIKHVEEKAAYEKILLLPEVMKMADDKTQVSIRSMLNPNEKDARLAEIFVVQLEFSFRLIAAEKHDNPKAFTAAEKCVVCMDRPATVVAEPCMHKTMCLACVDSLVRSTQNLGTRSMFHCPICRTKTDSCFSSMMLKHNPVTPKK